MHLKIKYDIKLYLVDLNTITNNYLFHKILYRHVIKLDFLYMTHNQNIYFLIDNILTRI